MFWALSFCLKGGGVGAEDKIYIIYDHFVAHVSALKHPNIKYWLGLEASFARLDMPTAKKRRFWNLHKLHEMSYIYLWMSAEHLEIPLKNLTYMLVYMV